MNRPNTWEHWTPATYAHVIARRPEGYDALLQACVVERDAAGGFWVDHALPAWGELVAFAAQCAGNRPKPNPAKPYAEWPRIVKAIAKRRREGEKGVGDTLERVFAKLGAKALTKVYTKVTGKTCGCAHRKDALNLIYPY